MNSLSFKRNLLIIVCTIGMLSCRCQQEFVKSSNGQFVHNGKALYFIGTNYWYGGLLGMSPQGRLRLQKELDFLHARGVNNLRVLVGVEGDGQINGVQRVKPALQQSQGSFDARQLMGLDYLLNEMGKRNMKAVLFLSNNWEWSGGFLQYLNWNGLIPDSIMQRKLSWDENRDYVSKFYSCDECTTAYNKQMELVVSRTNSISGKKYSDDNTIFSWELANEPRPMRPVAMAAYKTWISSVAAAIKKIDKNHMVTTGAEGDIGTETMELYEQIHADKNIDYLTIHIWPKNWGWFTGDAIDKDFDSVVSKSKQYIERHVQAAIKLAKPLVIEEFGLPRDHHQFSPDANTTFRNRYFSEIFSIWQKSVRNNGVLAGCNFWAFGGMARPVKDQLYWKEGDDYMGDPPMEEQGLNTVFDADTSTWNIIKALQKNNKK